MQTQATSGWQWSSGLVPAGIAGAAVFALYWFLVNYLQALPSQPLWIGGAVLGFVVAVMICVQEQRIAAAKRKEQYYMDLFELSPNGIIIHSQKTIRYANATAAKFLGAATPEELIGRPILDMVHPDIRAEVEERIRQMLALETPSVQRIEERLLRLDGSVIEVEISSAPIRNKAPAEGLFVVFQDITARKAAQAAREESERRLRQLVDLLPLGIVIHAQGKIEFVNPAGVRLLGAEKESQLLGLPAINFVHPAYRPTALQRIQSMFTEGPDGEEKTTVPLIEEVFLRLDGTPFDVEVSAFRLDDPSKRTAMVIIQDITERKQNERQLRESEALFRSLAETTNASIVIFRRDRVLYVNPAAVKITGYTKEELLNQPFWEIIHPEEQELLRQRGLARLEGKPVPAQYELRIIRKDGEVRWLETTARTIQYKGQSAVLGTSFDVTERKLAHLELARREEYYRSLLESIQELILLFDAEGRIKFLSPSVIWALGFDPRDVADNTYSLCHPDDRERMKRFINELTVSTQKEIAIEGLRFLHQDGEWHTIDIRGTNLLENEAVQGFLLTAHDVTERVRAQEKLEQNALRLELLSKIDRASLANAPAQEIAQLALSSLRQLVPCQQASVSLFDLKRGEAVTLAVDADSPSVILTDSDLTHNAKEKPHVGAPNQVEGVEGDDTHRRAPLAAPVTSLAGEMTRAYWVVPFFVQDVFLGTLNLAAEEAAALDEEHAAITREVADRLAVAIQNQQLFNNLESANKQLHSLSRRLVRVQEDEWRRLARELHDEVGQTLTVLSLAIEMAVRGDASQQSLDLEHINATLTELMAQVRDMSLRLRPTMLDDLGLAPALFWQCERYTSRTGIKVSFTHSGLEERLHPETETAVYRIVQEALTNVARHAGVDEVTVSVWVDEGFVFLQVADEGKGFDPREQFRKNQTAGLSGMRERATLLGGVFEIDSAPDGGTVISASIPIIPTEESLFYAHGDNRSG